MDTAFSSSKLHWLEFTTWIFLHYVCMYFFFCWLDGGGYHKSWWCSLERHSKLKTSLVYTIVENPISLLLEFLLDSVSVFCLIIFFQVGLEESSNTRMGWLSYYFYLRLDHMCIIVVFGYSKYSNYNSLTSSTALSNKTIPPNCQSFNPSVRFLGSSSSRRLRSATARWR